ncbi:NAD(P)-dependent oxidoreductase [Streptomyces spectabilis]|uniref:NAD(P)-dependent oxidoreductase n=1 Tax=Streptomyces spectabilis TaxID=68270 RepID=A0A516R0Y5_STRST|nr:NAD(P)-binding domain-containing protein [Streptomyces spectabilis]QDQ09324.1 NAD(P)-dependent oxidoreductase [Streptomyces spectabilis]
MPASPVTVLGLGPMGRALASAFLAAGHPTTVWNRTPGRAEGLVDHGAVEAATAAEAIAASDLVVVCVLDHHAVRAITGPHAAALKGRTLANLTAGTPDDARATAEWAASHGIDYLDGAIMVPTHLVGGPSTLVLHSGPADVYERHRDTLQAVGGTCVHLGTDPGRAGAHDVALLDIFWTALTGVVHAFALAGAEGVSPRDLAPYAKGVAGLLPDVIDEFAEQVDTGSYPAGGSNLRSAAAIMSHVLDASRSRGIDSTVISAAHEIAERGMTAGYGDASYAHVAELLRG